VDNYIIAIGVLALIVYLIPFAMRALALLLEFIANRIDPPARQQ